MAELEGEKTASPLPPWIMRRVPPRTPSPDQGVQPVHLLTTHMGAWHISGMADWLIAVTRSASGSVIQVAGDMDVATAPQVIATAEPLLVAGECLELDLRGLTFIDSQGLHALLTIRRHADASEAELVLAHPPGILRHLLEITGLADAFSVVDGDTG